jgi:SAM-dependent methyltransferase
MPRSTVGPVARVSCGTPAGSHSARVGGSTQTPSAVSTSSTELLVHASWWAGWEWRWNTVPSGIGTGVSSTAWPFCDIDWKRTALSPPGGRRSVAAMNENHKCCAGPEWADFLHTEVLPAVTRDVDLGRELIEVGPGPGASTEWLHDRVQRLVAIELEPKAASTLAARFAGTNVEVLNEDATALPFPEETFDSAGCFTMLHHLPTASLQNRLLAEVLRVLRPGGVLIGSDSLHSVELHHFHEGDTYNPIEPATLLTRLQTLGYEQITLSVGYAMTFVAHKPR